MTEQEAERLHELADLVHAVARRLPAPADLEPGPCTPIEISVMRFVGKHPGTSAREAAFAAGLPSSNFSRILKGLVARGLLERKLDKRDARGVCLYPTLLAKTNAERMRRAWSNALSGVSLDPATVAVVNDTLARIEAHLASTSKESST